MVANSREAPSSSPSPESSQLLLDERLPATRRRTRRFRAIGKQPRTPPHALSWILCAIWLLTNLAVFISGAFFNGTHRAVFTYQAYQFGVQRFTFGHLKLDRVTAAIILASLLACVRWMWLLHRVVYASGSVELRRLEDASGLADVDVRQLDAVFREYITLPRLYQVTTIPGDREPENFIEMLDVPTSSGWRGIVAAAFAYAFPKRAFIVCAVLRHRVRQPCYGVGVQVRALLGPDAELETQWSSSFETALQRAAYAVSAHLLPQTRRSLNAPWAGWLGRDLPVSLFRDYQRAKKMVAERRYDEALNLYRQALLQDAGNIAMRYDVGQLYERLGLYPDALATYIRLVNEIFPPRRAFGGAYMRRQSRPRWRTERSRDPFIIRYRYVISLGLDRKLAEELAYPQWPELRKWIHACDPESVKGMPEERPWRASELLNIQHGLSHELERLFPDITLSFDDPLDPARCSDRHTLIRLIAAAGQPGDEAAAAAGRATLQRYLLRCATREAELLIRDFRKRQSRWLPLRPWRSKSALTVTAMRLVHAAFQHRLDSLEPTPGTRPGRCHQEHLPHAEIERTLKKCGFDSYRSTSWLEHYNVACFYALMLINDTQEIPEHQQYAYAAVKRLERAQELGEEIAFVRTKRYWLQAGDPDLTGLRRYTVFRAFEARTYGVPFPADMDLGKYELYVHLRELLRLGSEQLELVWRQRSTHIAGVESDVFEEWWRREEHAWEVAIRLGRFYRQWQTRNAALDALRNWIAFLGADARPVPYPNLSRIDYIPNVNELADVQRVLNETEGMLDYLGNACGSLQRPELGTPSTILGATRAWRWYAERQDGLRRGESSARRELVRACESRVAIWAALRRWAITPDEAHRHAFAAAISALPVPPES